MIASTFRVTVYGDTYTELMDCAEEAICDFIGLPKEEFPTSRVSYEMSVEPSDGSSTASRYVAEIVARVKK